MMCLFVTDSFVCRMAVTKPVGTAGGTPVTAVGEGEVQFRTYHEGQRRSRGTALLFLWDVALCRWVSGSRRYEGN